MSQNNEDQEILLDSEKANIRKTGDSYVQTVPKRWLRRRDLRSFFNGQLEIRLVNQNGEDLIEIRRVKTGQK